MFLLHLKIWDGGVSNEYSKLVVRDGGGQDRPQDVGVCLYNRFAADGNIRPRHCSIILLDKEQSTHRFCLLKSG